MQSVNVSHPDGDPMAVRHTRVPIEGLGVAHVVTNPVVASTDVLLWRYDGSTPVECTHWSSCGGSSAAAQDMHAFWCDLETLTLCVRGVPSIQYFSDWDYMDRKCKQLFGRSFADY